MSIILYFNLVGALFRIKQGRTVAVLRSETLLKRNASTSVFQRTLQSFEEQQFYRISLMAVSETNRKSLDDNILIRNKNLRCKQQQQTTTNCRYKGIRQKK